MAKLSARPIIQTHLTISITEVEARAFDALVGYGTDAFLKVFYEKLGKAYLEPHEDGLRSLFKCFRKELPAILGRADRARKVFNGETSAHASADGE